MRYAWSHSSLPDTKYGIRTTPPDWRALCWNRVWRKYSMPDQYELWLHRPSSELYAVRLTRNHEQCLHRIAGVCGPLDPRSCPAGAALPAYRYQAGSFLQDLETRRDEFTVLR